MGRTNPTYRDALSAIEERWQSYRRVLRRRDRERFDALFGYAREHADAAGARNHRNPLVAALVGIVLAQERRHDEAAGEREGFADELAAVADRLDRIDGRLARIEDRLETVETAVDAAALDAQLDALDTQFDVDVTLDDERVRDEGPDCDDERACDEGLARDADAASERGA
jgi:hypothetical protein